MTRKPDIVHKLCFFVSRYKNPTKIVFHRFFDYLLEYTCLTKCLSEKKGGFLYTFQNISFEGNTEMDFRKVISIAYFITHLFFLLLSPKKSLSADLFGCCDNSRGLFLFSALLSQSIVISKVFKKEICRKFSTLFFISLNFCFFVARTDTEHD